MNILELFSGTGSVSKACSTHTCISVDIGDKYHIPTHKVDVLTWDYQSIYKPGHFDFIWASPPCQRFSLMNNMHYTKDEIERNIEREGLPLMRKTLEIIDYFKPKSFVIENPKGLMSKYIQQEPLYKSLGCIEYTADYCRYSSFGYRKRTHFWSNLPDLSLDLCNGQCENLEGTKHRVAISHQGKSPSLADRYRVPFQLIRKFITT